MHNGRTKLLKKWKWIFVSISILLFLGATYAVYMEEWSNFHAITPGKAYRSGETDRDELEYYVAKYNIKSILNLQGIRASDQHYRDEIAVCRERDLAHYDLQLSADKEPSRDTIDQLICIFKVAPRPILIHCKAGSDRAGLAAAIWKVVVDGESKRLAAEHLCLRYGHLPFGSATAMDDFFADWQPTDRCRATCK
jgi:protein tyrosine/serine phosphatase